MTRAAGKATETDDHPGSHGSCVSSKAVGLKSGVYKSSKLVVIKIDPILPIKDLYWAFDTVLSDMMNNADANPAVVAFSINSEPNPDLEEWGPIQTAMGKIFNAGGTIVVSSGNEAADNKDVDTLPAGWADAVSPLIVAGSVNNNGILSSFSQGPSHVTAWAPGEDVQCASRRNSQRQDFQSKTGTSFSTKMVSHRVSFQSRSFGATSTLIVLTQVAGLAAYGLALKAVPSRPDVRTPRAVKDWLRGTARWTRPGGTTPVIWNTLNGI